VFIPVFVSGVHWLHFLFFFWLKIFPAFYDTMNYRLQKQDYKMALGKYWKALRYLDICWEKEGIDEGELSLFS
jgi:peptidyl-prolyl isomerase D